MGLLVVIVAVIVGAVVAFVVFAAVVHSMVFCSVYLRKSLVALFVVGRLWGRVDVRGATCASSFSSRAPFCGTRARHSNSHFCWDYDSHCFCLGFGSGRRYPAAVVVSFDFLAVAKQH